MGRNNAAFLFIGLIFLLLGIGIKLFIGRRRFYRRNNAGLQGFKNYRGALLTPFFENILSLIRGILIIAGAFCVGMGVWIGK